MTNNNLTDDQITDITDVIDRVKTDERNLDTDEYLGMILDVFDRTPQRQHDHDELERAAQLEYDAYREEHFEEHEEPPPGDQAFVAGAFWALGRSTRQQTQDKPSTF